MSSYTHYNIPTNTPGSYSAPAPVYTDIFNDDMWITNGPSAITTTSTATTAMAPPTATAIPSENDAETITFFAHPVNGNQVQYDAFQTDTTSRHSSWTERETEKVVVISPANILFDEHEYNRPMVSSSSTSPRSDRYHGHDYYHDVRDSRSRTPSPPTTTHTASPRFGAALTTHPPITPTATYVGTAAATTTTTTGTANLHHVVRYPHHEHDHDYQQVRMYKGRIVKAKHAHLPDEVLAFRERRQQRTILATCTGSAVGLVTAGPVGAVVCGAGAYAAAKTVGKRRERLLLERCSGNGNGNGSGSSSPGANDRRYDNEYNSNDSSAFPTLTSESSSSMSTTRVSNTASNIPIHRAEVA